MVGSICLVRYIFIDAAIYSNNKAASRCGEGKLIHYFYYEGNLYAVCKDLDDYMEVK
jgi:hypothetical protein